MKHGEENNILYPLQHGFRKGHSCETQLIEFVDDISKNLQEGQQTDILILDFAKAFDKVNHSLLIHKLQHYGIIGKSVRWIQNWLANRKQSVVIDGSTSDAVSVDSGVPQGSVLGPGLFLYYINDLQSRLTSTVRLFADDTIAYLTISNNNDAETLQKDLDKLGHWEYEWCMKFHPDKCTVKYACSFIPIDWIFRFLRKKPRALFTLLVIEFMCWSHCNLSVNVRPKYLANVTDSSLCPWSWYLASIVFFLWVTLSTVQCREERLDM
jgi:hypothetical protein